MNLRSLTEISCGALLALSPWTYLAAQEQANTPTGANVLSSSSVSARQDIPLPPVPRPPVYQFRQLLVMSATERREFLANRPPESRRAIMAKVREYERMSAEEQELRLKATELHWYLSMMINTPLNERSNELATIPPEDRKLVEGRLARWDMLPPPLQKELLEHEVTIRYFAELAANTNAARSPLMASRRQALDENVRRWQGLSEEQRQRILRNFYDCMEMTPAEKARVLSTLSEPEQRQIEQTLKTFSSLPVSQRGECVRGFEKFATLTPEERRQFLKNADQWKAMTPTERQNWRDLVHRMSLQPPLPTTPIDLPPIPRVPVPRAVLVGTN